MGESNIELMGLAQTRMVDENGILTPQWAVFLNTLLAKISAGLPDTLLEIVTGGFTNNDPGAGEVSWSDIRITYGGKRYSIAPDDTTDEWIYWSFAHKNQFLTDSSAPTLSSTVILVGRNVSGTFTSLYRPQDRSELERLYAAIDADGLLEIPPLVQSRIKTAQSVGSITETFEDETSLLNSEYSVAAGSTPTFPDSDGQRGGKVCNMVNYSALRCDTYFPFDPTSLYRATARFRSITVDDNTKDNFALRLYTYDEDFVATSPVYTDMFYQQADDLDDEAWTELTVYLKGEGGTSGTGTRDDPLQLDTGARYFRIGVVANYNASNINEFEWDYFQVQEVELVPTTTGDLGDDDWMYGHEADTQGASEFRGDFDPAANPDYATNDITTLGTHFKHNWAGGKKLYVSFPSGWVSYGDESGQPWFLTVTVTVAGDDNLAITSAKTGTGPYFYTVDINLADTTGSKNLADLIQVALRALGASYTIGTRDFDMTGCFVTMEDNYAGAPPTTGSAGFTPIYENRVYTCMLGFTEGSDNESYFPPDELAYWLEGAEAVDEWDPAYTWENFDLRDYDTGGNTDASWYGDNLGVPTGTRAVTLSVEIVGGPADSVLFIRRKGWTGSRKTKELYTPAGETLIHSDIFVELDPDDPQIQVMFQNGSWDAVAKITIDYVQP